MYQVGNKVTWTSQAAGGVKTKEGTVYAVVPANKCAIDYLPAVSTAQVKFDSYYTAQERYIIAVPRGGKSTKVDYYCPRPSALRKAE